MDDYKDNFYGLLRHHQQVIESLEREVRIAQADLKEAYEAANRETARPKKFWQNWQKLIKDGFDAHRAMAQELNEMAVAHNMPRPFPGLIEPELPDEQQPAPKPEPPPQTPATPSAPEGGAAMEPESWRALGDIVRVEDADRSAHPSHL